MRKLLSFFIAFFCTLAQGCIFADGFETRCPVIIGYGSYGYIGAQVIGSGSTPGFLSDSSYLFDGKPGTLTNIQWIDGVQTVFSYTAIEFYVGIQPVTEPGDVPVGIVAILNTSLPEGLGAVLLINNSVVQIAEMKSTPVSTRTSCWFVFPITPTSTGTIEVQFHNVIAGNPTPPIDASAVFTVGEIWAGTYAEFKMKRDPKFGYEQLNKTRFSSSGASWPVPVPAIRNLSLNLAPLQQKETFTNAVPLSASDVIRKVFTAPIVAVLPFLNFDPATYGVSNDFYSSLLVSQTAMLGQFKTAPTISGNGDQYYDIAMSFVESV